MRYIPALDGLRALAVLVVIFVHCHVPGFAGGRIGVDVFFVLSGYLITRVLDEHRPSLREFYVRRARRLVPALTLMLLAYLAVYPLFVPGYPHLRDAAIAFFYLSDYWYAYEHLPKYIGHTWSLAVEEHFYLIWPLLFYRFRPSVRVLLAVFVAMTLWRWWPESPYGSPYYRFDTHATGLIVGCALAQFPRDRIPAWPGLVALAVLVTIPLDGLAFKAEAASQVAVELAAAVAVIGRLPAWLSHRWPVYLGKISYGVYLWQTPVAWIFVDHYLFGWQAAVGATLALSILFAAISHHTVEAWFRKQPARQVLIAAS